MTRFLLAIVTATALTVAAPAAHAGESAWTLRAGYAKALFSPSTELEIAGQRVPGADVQVQTQDVFLGDVGRDLGGGWIARVTFGLPVAVPVEARGSLAATLPASAGRVGEVEIAPLLGTLLYAPFATRGVRPYAGFGAGYVFVLGSRDGTIESLQASSEWVPVLQAGCDADITQRLSVFVDARWLPLATRVTGKVPALGGLESAADLRLDPTVISAGLGYRF